MNYKIISRVGCLTTNSSGKTEPESYHLHLLSCESIFLPELMSRYQHDVNACRAGMLPAIIISISRLYPACHKLDYACSSQPVGHDPSER